MSDQLDYEEDYEMEYDDLMDDEKVELEQAIVNGFLSKACGHLLPDEHGIVIIIEDVHVVVFAQYDEGFRTLGMRMAIGNECDMEDGTIFRLSMIEERMNYNPEE
jgi:hypothetical protein